MIEWACLGSLREFSTVARVDMESLSVRITSLAAIPAATMRMCGY